MLWTLYFVEKLDAAPGTEVVCCWKWNDDEKDRMVCSHSTEVWDNGDMSVAQFDAALKEVCPVSRMWMMELGEGLYVSKLKP